MSTIEIHKNNITHLSTDAIVNAANSSLAEGGGVCGAIFSAAGSTKLAKECARYGHCDTGNAVITSACDIRNAKYIIHAVGPVFHDGKHGEPKQLYSCYKNSLALAKEHGCRSIGFPLISAGIFGYPHDEAWKIALTACKDFISENPGYDITIVFVSTNRKLVEQGKSIFAELSATPIPNCEVFAELTAYIPQLKGATYGEVIIDRENEGTIAHPKQMPFVAYSRVVNDFSKSLFRCCEQHPEFDYTRYQDTLQSHGIEWDLTSMEVADVSDMDAKGVIALLVGAVRAERFCDGALLDFLESGCILRWLERLAEIDNT